MSFDEVQIHVRSGDGGGGMSHFRREKYVPRGGPDGGSGGKGGDVVLVATPSINTLGGFNHKQHFTAEKGTNGGSSDKTGASADPLRIEVPLGTVVRDADTGEVLNVQVY